jgi:hypothetical protein
MLLNELGEANRIDLVGIHECGADTIAFVARLARYHIYHQSVPSRALSASSALRATCAIGIATISGLPQSLC